MSLRRLFFASSLGVAAALAAACSSGSGGSDASRDAGPSTQDDAGGATPESGIAGDGRTLELAGTTQAPVTAVTVAQLAGQADLVTVGDDGSGSGPQVTVWGWSNGALQKSASYPAATAPLSIAAVDVAGSGSPELVVGVKTGSGGAVMVYPDSNGALGNAEQEVVAGADFLATGDLNEDGHPDVVAASASDGTITVLLGKADGTLTPTSAWTLGAKSFAPPTSATVVDLDGDGHLDLVSQVATTDAVLVLYGDGSGGFGSTGLIGTDGTAAIQALAISAPLGSSGGTTSAGAQPPSGATLVSGTFDAAGGAGVVFTAGGDLYTMNHQPTGQYLSALTEGVGPSPLAPIAFETGAPTDIAAVQTSGNATSLGVFRETVYGPLQMISSTPLQAAPTNAVSGDFDGDGQADLALTTATEIVILLNKAGS
jgi:hypothetical protein